MSSSRRKIEAILRDWNGEDAAARQTPEQIADRIDREYQEYLAELPRKAAVIKAGQAAHERSVA